MYHTIANKKPKKPAQIFICSMFVLPYSLELDIVYPLSDMNDLFYPQDYVREIKDGKMIGI